MADMNRGNRPLSPHLTIYRFQLPAISSIMHRVTGNGMVLGAVLLVWWFLAAAIGPGYFDFVNGLLTSWLGRLVLTASLWALWYHLLAGLRHLIWDQAIGLEMATAEKLGWAVVIGSVVLTLLTIIVL